MSSTTEPTRRDRVLESAVTTFARFGYRKTSMDAVAEAADISRPGLYFLFASKETLFRAAVTEALERDLAVIDRVMADDTVPLPARLSRAFEQWAGRYVSPDGRALTALLADNPQLLGTLPATASARFTTSIETAITRVVGRSLGARIAATLISTSIGLKEQVESAAEHRDRLADTIDLLLGHVNNV
jgi:AcrR family transcriptional regulator